MPVVMITVTTTGPMFLATESETSSLLKLNSSLQDIKTTTCQETNALYCTEGGKVNFKLESTYAEYIIYDSAYFIGHKVHLLQTKIYYFSIGLCVCVFFLLALQPLWALVTFQFPDLVQNR
jgi:hypothetical protein